MIKKLLLVLVIALCLAGCSNKNYYPWDTTVPTPKYQDATKTKTPESTKIRNTKSGVVMMFTLEGNPHAEGLWKNTLYGIMTITHDGPTSYNKPEVELFTSYERCLSSFETRSK